MNINQNKKQCYTNNLIKSSKNHQSNYNCSNDTYNKFMINDIIYDEQKSLVSMFKDFLLWDESSDFLRRYYNHNESSTRIPGIAEYYNNYTLITPSYAFENSKYLLKNIKKKLRLKDKFKDYNEENVEISLERYSTILRSLDMKSNVTFEERLYEVSLVSSDFIEENNISNILTGDCFNNFSISLASVNKLFVGDNNNSNIPLVLSNDGLEIKQKSDKKKLNLKIKFDQNNKKQHNIHTKKQLINSQKSFKMIVQNYLKKEIMSSRSGKPLFQKIQTNSYKNNLKDNQNRNIKSLPKYEEINIITPHLQSSTPLSFKSNLKAILHKSNQTSSRNNIISPSTFLKVDLTKENFLMKENSNNKLPTKSSNNNAAKSKVSSAKNVEKTNNNQYNTNKELINSNIFKTIISNLVTPNKKYPNKCVKVSSLAKKTRTITSKIEDSKFIKTTNYLGISKTNNTTSFNNSKSSSIYNINLNLNLNVNIDNSSKVSSTNTTKNNNNTLTNSTVTNKAKVKELNLNKINGTKMSIYDSNITKNINSPKKLHKKIDSEIPCKIDYALSDRFTPQEHLIKNCVDAKKIYKTIEKACLNDNSGVKKTIDKVGKTISKKSSVGFIIKIDANALNKINTKDKFVKSTTPACGNSLNNLLKLNLDLKILNTNRPKLEIKPSLPKIDVVKKIVPVVNVAKTKLENNFSTKGIKINNFDKILEVKKHLAENPVKNNPISEARKKVSVKTKK